MLLALTDVQAHLPEYARGEPPVPAGAVAQALDWAQERLERSGMTEPDPTTRQGRAFKRAVCAYALSLVAEGDALEAVEDVGTTVKIEGRGSTTVTAEHLQAKSSLVAHWAARAQRHLYEAGWPRSPRPVGASR